MKIGMPENNCLIYREINSLEDKVQLQKYPDSLQDWAEKLGLTNSKWSSTELHVSLKGHCIEFKYYADGIHSGLTPPGNNS